MRAPGSPDVLSAGTVPDPVAGPGEIVLRVAAAGVNRADLLQRQGHYPPPPGASTIIGLEASGVIEQLGSGVENWKVGDAVCALLAGGGYAELVAVPSGQLLGAPATVSLVEAAGIPEAFITAHDALFTRGRLQAGEVVLIHGGGGGVGTAAVQLASAAGATVVVTAGSREKIATCKGLGATHGINYRDVDFVAELLRYTGDGGANVILDVIGAAYLSRNLSALALDGRLVIIGLQGGAKAELDIAATLRRRQSIITTALRGRPVEEKAAIVERVRRDVMPGFDAGTVRVVIDQVLPLDQASEAHRLLEAGAVTGKILLVP